MNANVSFWTSSPSKPRQGSVLAPILLVLVLSCALAWPAVADADFTYTVANDEATITGYTGSGGDVVIPHTLGGYPVTGIGDRAFQGVGSLVSVIIPDGVTAIGDLAFSNCLSLVSVIIPDSVTSIGVSTFNQCESLISVIIPDGITSIEDNVFYNCTSLASVSIPDSVTVIGNRAFYNCTSLDSVTIPDSVTHIGSGAFLLCASLSSVEVPESVTKIGSSAFYKTGLKDVTIPGGVIQIGNDAFGYCSNLNEILVDPLNTSFSSLDGVLYNEEKTHLIQYPGGRTGNYDIPDGVTSIRRRAFFGCSLNSVTIPNSVAAIGSEPFGSCINMTDIHVSSDSDFYSSQSGVLYNANGTTLIRYPQGREGDFSIPDGVLKIERGAFSQNKALAAIYIPESVTAIGSQAFNECIGLARVVIPDSVTTIEGSAFAGCAGLSEVLLPANLQEISSHAFYKCANLTGVSIPEGVTKIGYRAFWRCEGLSTVSMGNGVEIIGNEAFYDCGNLETVELGSSVIEIGHGAFMATGLVYIDLPETLTGIGDWAFRSSRLRTVMIPSAVEYIGDSAFRNAGLRDGVLFHGDAPNHGTDVFVNSSAIIYRKAEAEGWPSVGELWAERPTALWQEAYDIALSASPEMGGILEGSGLYAHGAAVSVTATPSAGYEFLNWTEGGSAVSTDSTYTFTAMVDRHLTANFEPFQYTLTYTADDNGTISGEASQSVEHGANGEPVTAVPDEGYHFTQWSDGLTEAQRQETAVAGSLSVTAHFAVNEYAVTFDLAGNGERTGGGELAQTVVHGGAAVAPEVEPHAGWTFAGWDGSFDEVTEPLTITAQYERIFHDLIYTAADNGTILGEASQSVEHGADGTAVTAVPEEGHHFTQWNDGLTEAQRQDTAVTESLSVTAHFAINEYAVTFDLAGNGERTGGGELAQTVVHGGAAVAPEVEPHAGWTFAGWDASFDEVTEPLTITAQYERIFHDLTYTAGANGTISGDTSQTVEHGADGSPVEAVPDEGYHFTQWSDGRDDNPRSDLAVTAALAVTAYFESSDSAGYSGGSGTASDPFLIASVDDWLALIEREDDWDKYFRVVADIDFEGVEMTPVGIWEQVPFAGAMDGGGHLLSNIAMNLPAQSVVGLFGCVASSGVIQNLTIEDLTVVGSSAVGGLAGWSAGTISDCRVSGSITGDSAGGLIGVLHEGTVERCSAECAVTGSFSLGGLIGVNDGGVIEGSHASDSVNGGDYVGGLVGIHSSGIIRACKATGAVAGGGFGGGLVGCAFDIIEDSHAYGSVEGESNIGGLVGALEGAGEIARCSAHGAVEGRVNIGGLVGQSVCVVSDSHASGMVMGSEGAYMIGGFAGLVQGVVDSCYATGDVSAPDGAWGVGGLAGYSGGLIVATHAAGNVLGGGLHTGGLAGQNAGTIANGYATGTVGGNRFVGGLVGFEYGTIYRCYATGATAGTEDVGGLLGYSYESVASASYWNIETSGQPESEGGEGRTTAEMTHPHAANTYVDWDFDDVWAEDVAGVNNGYPLLRWQVGNEDPEDDIPDWMKPDFVVTEVVLDPKPTVPGAAFTATVTVLNQGDIPGDAGTLRVWAAAGADPVDEAIGELAVDATATRTFALTAPDETGTYLVRAFADADDVTEEKSEGNNQKTATYTLHAAPDPDPDPDDPPSWMKPDFIVTEIVMDPKPSVAGAEFTAHVTVKNQGDIPGDGGLLRVWVSRPSPGTVNAPGWDAELPVGTLDVGETKTLTFEDLEAASPAGWHHFLARVNARGADDTDEKSFGNNHRSQVYRTYDIFLVKDPSHPDGVELRWNSQWGLTYRVLRSTNLMDGYEVIESGIGPTPPENVYIDIDPPGTMQFYMIDVD